MTIDDASLQIGENELQTYIDNIQDYDLVGYAGGLTDDDINAVLTYKFDRNLFYDKLKNILQSVDSTCNYVQILSKDSTPDTLCSRSWFLREYIEESKEEKCETSNKLEAFLTLVYDDLEECGLYKYGFCWQSLHLIELAIKNKQKYPELPPHLANCFGNEHNPQIFCSTMVRALLDFDKRNCLPPPPPSKPFDPEDYMIDYDKGVRGPYHKLDLASLDELNEPFYIKFCVFPADYKDVSIKTLVFDHQTVFYLTKAKVMTLEQLLNLTPLQLSRIVNISEVRINDIYNGLTRKFGERIDASGRGSLYQCKMSYTLRNLLPNAKQNAINYICDKASGKKPKYTFSNDVQSAIDDIFDTLGGELCTKLIAQPKAFMTLSSILFDMKELNNRNKVFANVFDALSNELLTLPARTFAKLCDDTHGTALQNLELLSSNDKITIGDFKNYTSSALSRKELSDLLYFVSWLHGGANKIAENMLSALFEKYPSRLRFVRCLANEMTIQQAADENCISTRYMMIAHSQLLRKLSTLPACFELMQFIAIITNKNGVSLSDIDKHITIADKDVLKYLLSAANMLEKFNNAC